MSALSTLVERVQHHGQINLSNRCRFSVRPHQRLNQTETEKYYESNTRYYRLRVRRGGRVGASDLFLDSRARRGRDSVPFCELDANKRDGTVAPALFFIHAPLSIGGRSFLVTSSLVDALWPSAASKAAAVTSGLLVVQGRGFNGAKLLRVATA